MEMEKYKDEIQQELEKIKLEEIEIEKGSFKLSEVRENVSMVNKILFVFCKVHILIK